MISSIVPNTIRDKKGQEIEERIYRILQSRYLHESMVALVQFLESFFLVFFSVAPVGKEGEER